MRRVKFMNMFRCKTLPITVILIGAKTWPVSMNSFLTNTASIFKSVCLLNYFMNMVRVMMKKPTENAKLQAEIASLREELAKQKQSLETLRKSVNIATILNRNTIDIIAMLHGVESLNFEKIQEYALNHNDPISEFFQDFYGMAQTVSEMLDLINRLTELTSKEYAEKFLSYKNPAEIFEVIDSLKAEIDRLEKAPKH